MDNGSKYDMHVFVLGKLCKVVAAMLVFVLLWKGCIVFGDILDEALIGGTTVIEEQVLITSKDGYTEITGYQEYENGTYSFYDTRARFHWHEADSYNIEFDACHWYDYSKFAMSGFIGDYSEYRFSHEWFEAHEDYSWIEDSWGVGHKKSLSPEDYNDYVTNAEFDVLREERMKNSREKQSENSDLDNNVITEVSPEGSVKITVTPDK